MRFSELFDTPAPLRAAQGEEHPPQKPASTTDRPASSAQEVPDDLDQRVRQTGEWQLEDW
ncbi:MAG TPA: hypothetical protein VHA82_10005 [Ramlibacter sp.]|uniref:hypothetical protein n=1 Tax=Ramlibacter sp. TaxID=1917967 RepID=UPI002C56BEB0|nr:hypothetical protein [Ramlibacter sp.]HVZ44130.1 hypothetical protein [Ramlibacter sp.]